MVFLMLVGVSKRRQHPSDACDVLRRARELACGSFGGSSAGSRAIGRGGGRGGGSGDSERIGYDAQKRLECRAIYPHGLVRLTGIHAEVITDRRADAVAGTVGRRTLFLRIGRRRIHDGNGNNRDREGAIQREAAVAMVFLSLTIRPRIGSHADRHGRLLASALFARTGICFLDWRQSCGQIVSRDSLRSQWAAASPGQGTRCESRRPPPDLPAHQLLKQWGTA